MLLAAVAAGCSFHAPRRTPKDAAPAPPVQTSTAKLSSDEAHRAAVARSSIEDHRTFRLGIVEFDDQGQFWSRAQYDAVIADLRKTYDAGPQGVQAIVFVHGWKHSASVCDPNLACFRELLASFAEREGQGGRPVYGIYVGWRGLSLKGPLIKEFSFWGRKTTAHRVGAGDVVELLGTIESIHRQKRETAKMTRLTTIGHSFGGAMVFAAVSESLRERMAGRAAQRPPAPGLFTGFGTLTLLVNPAFEASLYQGIDAMLRLHPGLFDARNPRVLVTVASEGDTATRVAFPLGRVLSTLLQRTRGGEQRRQIVYTLGNYKPFATHRLEPTPETTRGEVRSGACLCPSKLAEGFAAEAEAAAAGFSATMSEEFFGTTKLVKTGRGPQADSPFIVVRADRRVIADHGDIWSRPFVEFMAALITRTDALLMR